MSIWTQFMQPQYSQLGNYTALFGLAVIVLSKFGVTTDTATLMQIVGAIFSLIGIVKQWIDHKNLAVSIGAIQK